MNLLLFKVVATILFFIPGSICLGQFNLIPNNSFEAYDTCPTYHSQLYRILQWTNPLTGTTPDYFNSCYISGVPVADVPQNYFGYQFPKTGNAYAGLINATYTQNINGRNYREYIQAELNDTLIAGEEYFLKFYTSAGDSCQFVSNNLSVYFSPSQITDTTNLNPPTTLQYTPQLNNNLSNNLGDRNIWKEVSWQFIAQGDEKFIIIGNFNDTTSTIADSTYWTFYPNSNLYAYLYIDDILLTPSDSLTGLFEDDTNNFNYTISDNILSINTHGTFIKKILIYNYMGQKLLSNDYYNIDFAKINLNNLPNSYYLISIQTDLFYKYLKIHITKN